MRGPKRRRCSPISKRNLAIYMARCAGTQYKDIAAEHGITVVRARQVYEHWNRCFFCSWRAHFIPADVLAHLWTPEEQWEELEREREAQERALLPA